MKEVLLDFFLIEEKKREEVKYKEEIEVNLYRIFLVFLILLIFKSLI